MSFGNVASITYNLDNGTRPSNHAARAIYIRGTTEPEGLYNNLIGIDLASFRRDSLAEFLEVLRSRRPDLEIADISR